MSTFNPDSIQTGDGNIAEPVHVGRPGQQVIFSNVNPAESYAAKYPTIESVPDDFNGTVEIVTPTYRATVKGDGTNKVVTGWAANKSNYDVVIYGATPGGIMAAIAAKDEGATVAIFERTNHIGGMTTGGLSWTDIIRENSSASIVGLADKFYRDIAGFYNITYQNYWRLNLNGEPKISSRFLAKWLTDADINIFSNEELVSVNKTGTSINYGIFSGIGPVTGKNWIDSTYEGDLIALAGCTTTIGREAAATYSEAHAGVVTIAGSAPQFTNPVDPYVIPGDATSGLIAGIWDEPLGTIGAASPYVMPFTYRLTLMTGASKIAFPEPSNYNALDYELLGRHAVANGSGWTLLTQLFSIQQLKNLTKWDCNNLGPISLDFVSPLATEYVTASSARRSEIEEITKQYILGLFKFIKTDARIPAAVRADVLNYGLCNDEFLDQDGFSPQLYVREGRRLVGDFVLKESDLTSANAFTDEISLASYPSDAHTVRVLNIAGEAKTEGGQFITTVLYGNKIPFRIILPKVTECTNLVSTFATSASHIAFGSIRMEPNHMAIGQAAGIASAWAARDGNTVQATDTAALKVKQNIYGVANSDAGATISTDTTYADGTKTIVGTWATVTTLFPGVVGASFRTSAEIGASITFKPNLKQNGRYKVYLKWPDRIPEIFSAIVPITVVDGSGVTTNLVIDQRNATAAEGGNWALLGSWFFAKGTPSANSVAILTDGAGGLSGINAIKWVLEV